MAPYADLEEKRPVHWDGTHESTKTGELRTVHNTQVIGPELIEITFPVAPESNSCARHDIDVVETAESITITLYGGFLKGYKDLPCAEFEAIQTLPGAYGSMVVETKEPIGDREVIDGTPDPQENAKS